MAILTIKAFPSDQLSNYLITVISIFIFVLVSNDRRIINLVVVSSV